MVRKSELPIYDANGDELHIGDVILMGARVGDPKGWTEHVIVEQRASDELLAKCTETGECSELNGDARLRGLVRCPHRTGGS